MRVDAIGCGQAYVIRLVLLPVAFQLLEGCMWRAWLPPVLAHDKSPTSSDDVSPVVTRRGTYDTPEMKVRKRPPAIDGLSDFKL